jgi:hypothetical protein
VPVSAPSFEVASITSSFPARERWPERAATLGVVVAGAAVQLVAALAPVQSITAEAGVVGVVRGDELAERARAAAGALGVERHRLGDALDGEIAADQRAVLTEPHDLGGGDGDRARRGGVGVVDAHGFRGREPPGRFRPAHLAAALALEMRGGLSARSRGRAKCTPISLAIGW